MHDVKNVVLVCLVINLNFEWCVLQVFDIDSGSLKFAFGSAGEGNGQFGAPTGVAVDKQGNILVADWGNSRIQVSQVFCNFDITLL